MDWKHLEVHDINNNLNSTEVRILKFIKSNPCTEKGISRQFGIHRLTLSPIMTALMLKGYVEILRVRRFYFFRREYFVITLEGMEVLNASRTSAEKLLDLAGRAMMMSLDNISRIPAPGLAKWILRSVCRIGIYAIASTHSRSA
jgi:DNA-binding MarR family transcriptional regulator